VTGQHHADRPLQRRRVDLVRSRHDVQQRVADRDRVAAADREQQLLQRRPDGDVEPANRAEVEQGQPPVLEQQDVARMRVGVEDPSSTTWRSSASSSVRASVTGSSPRVAISGPAEASGTPSSRCMTSSRRVHSSRCGTGTTTSREVAPTAIMFAASTRKSSSSRSASANPSASSRTPSARAQVVVEDSVRASRSTMSRSRTTTGSIPGRCTLSTTCSPEPSVAVCT
jgi:hypothetical protein